MMIARKHVAEVFGAQSVKVWDAEEYDSPNQYRVLRTDPYLCSS